MSGDDSATKTASELCRVELKVTQGDSIGGINRKDNPETNNGICTSMVAHVVKLTDTQGEKDGTPVTPVVEKHSSMGAIDNHSIRIDVHETPAQHSKLNGSEDDIPDLEDAPIITYVRTPVIMQPPSTDSRKLVSPELVLEVASSNSKDKTIKDTDIHTGKYTITIRLTALSTKQGAMESFAFPDLRLIL